MAVVPATRRAVAVPQPRRAPATRERRPQLRVVEEPARRSLSLGVITVLVVGGVFALLFGLVVFHTMLLQNQQRLDRITKQVSEEQARYQSSRLKVAQLESPQRIIDEATHRLGMVPPDGTTYLTPAADAVAGDPAGANQVDSTGASDTAAPADGASAWPEVKPYLGAAP
jgi:cell division protein FtsL